MKCFVVGVDGLEPPVSIKMEDLQSSAIATMRYSRFPHNEITCE